MQLTWQYNQGTKPVTAEQLLEIKDNIQSVYDRICQADYTSEYTSNNESVDSANYFVYNSSTLFAENAGQNTSAKSAHNYNVYQTYFISDFSNHLSNVNGTFNSTYDICPSHNHSQYISDNQSKLQTYNSNADTTYQQCNQNKSAQNNTHNASVEIGHNHNNYAPYSSCPAHKSSNNSTYRSDHMQTYNSSNLTGHNSTNNTTENAGYWGPYYYAQYNNVKSANYTTHKGSYFGNDYTAELSYKTLCEPLLQ